MAIFYQASPKPNLQVIDPGQNNEGKVFAARQLDMAHAFLGRTGRGLVMGQRRENNIPVFTEKLRHSSTGIAPFLARSIPSMMSNLSPVLG
jgi:hypothetical protein